MRFESPYWLCSFWTHFARALLQVNVRCVLSALVYWYGASRLLTDCSYVYCAWVCGGWATLCTGISFLQLWSAEQINKSPSLPEVIIYLLAIPPPPAVVWASSIVLWRNTVEWGPSYPYPTNPSSWLKLGSMEQPCQEDEARGSCDWEKQGHAFNGVNVAPTLEPYHPVFVRFSYSCSSRRSAPLIPVRRSQLSTQQEQTQKGGTTGTWENKLKMSSIGCGSMWSYRKGDELHTSHQLHRLPTWAPYWSFWGIKILEVPALSNIPFSHWANLSKVGPLSLGKTNKGSLLLEVVSTNPVGGGKLFCPLLHNCTPREPCILRRSHLSVGFSPPYITDLSRIGPPWLRKTDQKAFF